MSDSLATQWTIAHQAPLSVGFPSQENWSGLPFPSPGERSPVLKAKKQNKTKKTFCATSEALVLFYTPTNSISEFPLPTSLINLLISYTELSFIVV